MNNRIFSLVLCFAIGGCTAIKPYRTDLNLVEPCIGQSSVDCPTDAFFLKQMPDDLGYDIQIGIIEFDDQGSLLRRQFKTKIIDRVRSLGNEQDVMMVVFAHGWKNNAAPDNDNLRDFQEILARLAHADKEVCQGRSCKDRQVVGIYLAWRGLSASTEPFKTLSFWNRKSRAHRVGQDGATEVLAELAKISAQRPKNNRLVIVGHSFGGALVYSATQQLLMKDTAFLNRGSVPRSTADLVILVNPAFEAARFTSLHEKAASLNFQKTQKPILAIFTSVTDTATKKAFPMGRAVSTLFTKYNPERPEQSKLNRTAVGHYAGFQTHALTREGEDASFTPLPKSVCSWEQFQNGNANSWGLGKVALVRKDLIKKHGQHNNPYYNVAVDDVIISGHNKIWGDQFMEFLYRFVAVQDAKPCVEGGEKQ